MITFRFMPRIISISQKYQHCYEETSQDHDAIRGPASKHDQSRLYLMIVTGLRIQASWVMFSIDC